MRGKTSTNERMEGDKCWIAKVTKGGERSERGLLRRTEHSSQRQPGSQPCEGDPYEWVTPKRGLTFARDKLGEFHRKPEKRDIGRLIFTIIYAIILSDNWGGGACVKI